jgi:hypothetical protein
MATAVHDVLDDVLVHHLELSLALLVESVVLGFKLFEICFGRWGAEEISWNDAVRLDWNKQAELSHRKGE